MPISNWNAPGSAGSSDYLVSNSGFRLGGNGSAGQNDFYDAYQALVNSRQQQQNGQMQQQEQKPDWYSSGNGRDMNLWEQGVHGLAEFGESISDPFGWAKKWQETKDRAESGEANIGDYAETGARFLGSLIPGMIGGLLTDPEKLTEAATGANLQESYNGQASNKELTGEQRLGDLVNAGIDVVSFIPGVGIEGTLAKGGMQLAKGGIQGVARDTAAEAGEQAAKSVGNKSLLERGAEALFPEHKFASGLALTAASEAGQEFVQSFAEDVRGYGDKYGFDEITGDNFQGAMDKALESAAFGALGGGAFHTLNTGVNYGLNVLQSEAGKAGRSAQSLAATNQAITEENNSYANMYTARERHEDVTDNMVANVIARDVESKQADQAKRALGYSGTMVGNQNAYGNYMVPSSANIMASVANNETSGKILDQIFGTDDTYSSYKEQFVDAVRRNDTTTGHTILNEVAKQRDDAGNPIEALFYKQPATNNTPVKGWIREFSANPNEVGVDEAIASTANADYDGDLAAMMFDANKIGQARLFTDSLLDGAGKSTVDWGDSSMDIHGWTDDQLSMLKTNIEIEFGRGALDMIQVTIPGVNYGNPVSSSEAIDAINKIDNKDQRFSALSSMFQQMQWTNDNPMGINISNMWKYIQTQAMRQQAIEDLGNSRKSAPQQAVDKYAKTGEGGEAYVLQSEQNPYTFPVQNAFAHDDITNENFGVEEANRTNSGFRSYTRSTFYSQGTGSDVVIGQEGDTSRPATQYELFILANLDMVVPGIHDNSKIMSLYNGVCRDVVDRAFGGKFTIGPDFSMDMFSDALLEEINFEVRQYNHAIKEMFFDGLDTVDAGPFLKKPVTKDTIAEFIYGIYKDEFTLADMMPDLLAANPEIESVDGINDNLGRYFLITKGEPVPEIFWNQADSNGNTNREIGELISKMKHASDSIWSKQEENFRDAIKDLSLMDESTLDATLASLTEEQRAELMQTDQAKMFNRFAELVGSEVLVANGVARFGSWKNSKAGKLFMYGTDEQRLNVVWNMLFKTHTAHLFNRLINISKNPSKEGIADVVAWLNLANKNDNPIFRAVEADIQLEMLEGGVIVVEDGELKLAKNPSDEAIAKVAQNCSSFLNSMASDDVAFGDKTKWIDMFMRDTRTGKSPSVPLFMWLRSGLEDNPSELGLSQKIMQANAASMNLDTKNAEKMLGELNNLENMIARNNIPADEALRVFSNMASNMYVTVSDDLTYNELFSTFLTQRAAIEKGQSVEGASRSAAAKRMQLGQPFVTLFNQNTVEIGNSISISDFASTRRQILGCLFGEVDPMTGEKFEVNVFDSVREDYVTMTQEEMLGLAEGEEVTFSRIMDFLKANPNIASWMKPMTIQPSRSGDNRSAGPIASKKTLWESFDSARKSISRTDEAGDNYATRKAKRTILEAAGRIPHYNALILGCIPSPETITSPHEFRNRAKAAKKQVDNWILSSVVNFDSSDWKQNYQRDLEVSIATRLDQIFETTRDEAVTDSLLADNVASFRRKLARMQDEQLLVSYMQVIDPKLQIDETAASMAIDTEETIKQQTKMILQEVVMDRLLVSTGQKFDPIEHLKTHVSFDAIVSRFKDLQAAQAAFKKLTSASMDDAIFSDINEIINEFVLDESVLVDDNGEVLSLDQVATRITEYACNNKWFAVERSFIRDEIIPKLKKAYAGGKTPDIDDIRPILAQVHQKCALEYYRGEASRRGKMFDGTNESMMRQILGEMIPKLRSMITREYDPEFFSKLDDVSIKDADMPTIQWFNPVTSRTMMRSIDFQTSGDSEMRIGMEGQTPKFLSFIGFLNGHSCEHGTMMSIGDIQALDVSDETRYSIVVDPEDKAAVSIISGITGNEGSNRLDLTAANRDALLASGVQNAQQFNVMDRTDKAACTCGLCSDHAGGMIEFRQQTMACGQESRTMKLKKVFRSIEDVVKGLVDKSTVVKRTSISENISPQKILDEHADMVERYASAIRTNSTKKAFTGFGGIDEDIDWSTWSLPFAKMMIPCVKVRFSNGDTCSISINDLHADEVADPLYQDGMKTHGPVIDWSQVDSVEMRILGAEELSTHVINSIEAAEVKAAQEGTDVDYAGVARDSFMHWGTRSRYCQETNEDATRLSRDDVLGRVRYMSSSMYDPPAFNVLPSSVDRFLGNRKFKSPERLHERRFGVGSLDGKVKREMIDELINTSNAVVEIITDQDSSNSSSFYIRNGLLDRVKGNSAAKLARENDAFISEGEVIYDISNPSDEQILDIVRKAAEYDVTLVMPSKLMSRVPRAIGIPDANIDADRYSEPGYEMFSPRDIMRARNSYKNGTSMQMARWYSEPYRMFLDTPGYGPTEDSFIAMTADQAKKWEVSMENEPASFTVKNLNGKKLAVLDSGEDFDVLSRQVTELLTEGRAKPASEERKNRDMPLAAYDIFDFSSAYEAGSDISDMIMLQRISEYLDKIEDGDCKLLTNVHQGDVIAIGRTGEPGNFKYYPVVYQGAVPVVADLVNISEHANGSGVVNYTISFSSDMSQGDSIKQYCLDIPGVKAQAAQTVDYSAQVAFKDANIPLSGFLHHASMGSRLTPTLTPSNVKLSMFVALRQYVTFDKFEGLNENNVASMFDDLGGFSPIEVAKAFTRKEEGVRDLRFWRALASGNVKIKGVTNEQQAAISRLTMAFINANTSPAFLFSSRYNGKADGFSSSDWTMVLSETAGVRLDDVMAFCNWVDPDFCDPYAKSQTDQEFINSGKFMDSTGRIMSTIIEADGTTKNVVSYLRASRTRSNGATNVRGISDTQSFNNQLQYLMLVRNGVQNCDPKAAMVGMRSYLSKFSDQEINDLYQSDPDVFFKKLTDPAQFTHDMTSYRSNFIYKAKVRGPRVNDWFDSMREFYDFYNKTPMPEVWSKTNNETVNIEEYYRHYANKYPKMTKELYMRLIMANINWTKVNSTEASGRIPFEAFRKADQMIREAIDSKKLPLFAKEIRLDDSTTRIGSGAIEPWFLHDLCNAIGYEYDVAIKEVAENLKEARRLVSEMNSGTSVRKNQEAAVEYLELTINGATDTAFLGSNTSLKDLVDGVSEVYDYITNQTLSDRERFSKMIRQGEERMDAIANANEARNRISVSNDNARFGTYNRNNRTLGKSVDNLLNGAVKMRQAMAMAGVVIPVANLIDTAKGNAFQRLGNRLGRMGVGPYGHTWENAIEIDNQVVEAVAADKNVQAVIEARKLAATMGPEEMNAYNNFIKNGGSAADYLAQHTGLRLSQPKDLPHKAYGMVMRFGSAAAFNKKSTARNFIQNFQRVAGSYGFTELGKDGVKSLERDLLSESGAASAINNLFSDPAYAEAAEVAWNMTMQGSMAQETALSWFGERLTMNRSWMKFIGATIAGVPFFRATVNLTTRTMKNIIPGMSTMNYLMVDYMKKQGEIVAAGGQSKIFTEGPLAKILQRSTQVDGETLAKEFAAEADALKMYVDLREAIMVDLAHMTLPMFAAVLALSGAIQPPDDDDRYDNYEEWTLFGQRIGLLWWMKDIVGPVLPWACYYKAGIDGRPSSGIMVNGMCDFLNMSPFLTANNALRLVMEPDSALDTYEETKDWYSDSREGTPDVFQYITGSAQAIGLSYLASLVTPKIVSDINTYMVPDEVSYNRKYVVDETGQAVYNEDGTRKTEKVSFSEAQLRKITRNNFLIGGLMNMLTGWTGDGTNGWTAAEMPKQDMTDPAQIACMKSLSVWDYDRQEYKSDDEIAEVCTAILLILDNSNDMNALYHEGFYLDSYTKQAVSDYIWDLYQTEVDEWNALVQSGATNYYVAGNGDYNTGMQIVSEMKEKHYATLNFYKQELYYGKLRSSDLNQGLVHYNRYNTTYAKDANGDWYATGFRQNVFPLMPFMSAPQEGTAGNSGSWATLSAVTGEGMYDQKGDPYRALEPYVDKDFQWKKFEELGGGTDTNGKSTNYPIWSPSGSRGGGGGGGSRGGGGGGYSKVANKQGPMSSTVSKAPYINGQRNPNPHNVNFSRPNLGNVLDGKSIRSANLDYLRPNFETKGSREAYKRSDF